MRRFLNDENGTASVEAVIWFPIYMLVIGLVFDSTMLLIGKTEMWSIANDTSRMVALGRMDEATAENYVENIVGKDLGLSADVSTTGDVVTTTITRDFRSVPSIGVITSLSAELETQSHYRIEPTT